MKSIQKPPTLKTRKDAFPINITRDGSNLTCQKILHKYARALSAFATLNARAWGQMKEDIESQHKPRQHDTKTWSK